MLKYSFLFMGVFFIQGCQDQHNLNLFDEEKSYIEFGEPVVFSATQRLYLDSTYFSFAEQEIEVKNAVLALPIHIIGQQKNYDREYIVGVDADVTSFGSNLFQLSKPIVRSGRFSDTLYVDLKRNEELESGIFEITFYLDDNAYFRKGQLGKTKRNFLISAQLLEPEWWTAWRPYFGPYRPEVYQQWIRIYRTGLDKSPTVFVGEKPNYSWINMPMYALKEYYPVTFMYLEKLKKYFKDNEVYPNGDMTKPRIYLPK